MLWDFQEPSLLLEEEGGPIVTSILFAKGRKSKYVVGTVSLADFFVTLAASIVFLSALGKSFVYCFRVVLGEIIASPIAVKLVGSLPQKAALLFVPFLVILFSIRTFLKILV
ncbi:hypothetical protein ACFS5J_07750 [Flavobacterium chuncheonense]|uniref:Uncharacterized protein n=1 Tax=Flavobacterium chuncheonense TaxID=2026653 RepID=A0ABW5YLR5_9FLAO